MNTTEAFHQNGHGFMDKPGLRPYRDASFYIKTGNWFVGASAIIGTIATATTASVYRSSTALIATTVISIFGMLYGLNMWRKASHNIREHPSDSLNKVSLYAPLYVDHEMRSLSMTVH